jgi:hypothetical protein
VRRGFVLRDIRAPDHKEHPQQHQAADACAELDAPGGISLFGALRVRA